MQQQQQQFQMQQQQQHQFHLQQQQFQVQQQQQHYQIQQQLQQQQQQQQPLVSQFNFLHLIESLVEAAESSGTRDQNSDALVNELSSQFEKCQKRLNTISSSLGKKGVTVESQKQKLEETEQLVRHRRDLIANYRRSVQDLLHSDSNI